jgi:hypothetical protein
MAAITTIPSLKRFSNPPPSIVPTQIIFHSACDNYGVSGHLSWQLSGSLESHVYISRPGALYQIVNYTQRAQANYQANRRSDGTGALSAETGSDIEALDPWSDEQIDTMVEWARERISQFPRIARQRCPSPTAPGIGFHTMFGAPSAWTPVAKTCPGPERKKQFASIVLPRIVASDPVVIDGGQGVGTAPAKPAPTPTEPTDTGDDEMIVACKGLGGQWLTWPKAGVRVHVKDVVAKDQFLAKARQLGIRVEDWTGQVDEDGYLQSLADITSPKG